MHCRYIQRVELVRRSGSSAASNESTLQTSEFPDGFSQTQPELAFEAASPQGGWLHYHSTTAQAACPTYTELHLNFVCTCVCVWFSHTHTLQDQYDICSPAWGGAKSSTHLAVGGTMILEVHVLRAWISMFTPLTSTCQMLLQIPSTAPCWVRCKLQTEGKSNS